MGLLNSLFGDGPDDPRNQAMGAMAAGLLGGSFRKGLLGANAVFAEAPMNKLRMGLMEAQMQEAQAQAEARKLKAAQDQAEAQRKQRIQQGLPALYRAPGMTGGQAVPQTFGGTDVPMFSKPLGAAPVQMTPGGFDLQGAMGLGITDPEQLAKYAALANIGRQKVARTVKGMGPDGKEYEYQVDEFGQRVGDGMAQWKAPHYQDLGGKVGVFDGYGHQTGGLGKTQTPDSVASNAVAWANNALTRRGQDLLDQRSREANAQGKTQIVETPQGFVIVDKNTGQSRPATGADGQPLRGKANDRVMTDAQAKANLFGTRMKESDRILSELENNGVTNTGLIKGTVQGVAGMTPFMGDKMSDAAGSVMNTMPGVLGGPNSNQQLTEQARRDFLNAVLRRESGAVISPQEFSNADKQYFPQPGDSKAVLDQKRKNRKLAIAGLEAEVPGGFRGLQPNTPTQTGGAAGEWGGGPGKVVDFGSLR